MPVTTNNRPRPLLDWADLTPAERESLDWADPESASFFRYQGCAYALGEFIPAPADLAPWTGVAPDSWFSGVVIRFAPDHESVIVGRYCA